MAVVQMDDHRGQDQALLAALRAAPDRPFQAVEQAVEALGTELSDFLGQPVDALVGRAQRARSTGTVVVLTEGLIGPPLDPEADRRRELVLVVPDGLLHHDDPSVGKSTPVGPRWVVPSCALCSSRWRSHCPSAT